MSYRRYEIILPTRYNDGTSVEPAKYLQTRRELAARFGALTFLPQPVHGEWFHERKTYEETNVRILLDVEDTTENAQFFAEFKKTLKERFRQIDIWIVSFEIRII